MSMKMAYLPRNEEGVIDAQSRWVTAAKRDEGVVNNLANIR